MNRKIFAFWVMILLAGNVLWAQSTDVAKERSNSVYNGYESRKDLTVAQIVDYPVDSNLFVNVVMLEADDDESWNALEKEFGVKALTSEQLQRINKGYGFSSFLYKQAVDPTQPAPMDGEKVNKLESCILIAAHHTKTLWIFHYNTEEEASKVYNNYFDKHF